MAAPSTVRTAPAASDTASDDMLDRAEDASEAAQKPRAGIQSIEVGFRLLDALTREPGAMMLRDLATRAAMSPAKAHRYS